MGRALLLGHLPVVRDVRVVGGGVGGVGRVFRVGVVGGGGWRGGVLGGGVAGREVHRGGVGGGGGAGIALSAAELPVRGVGVGRGRDLCVEPHLYGLL